MALFAANDIALVYTNDLMTELPFVAAGPARCSTGSGASIRRRRGCARPGEPRPAGVDRRRAAAGPALLRAHHRHGLAGRRAAHPARRRRYRAALVLGVALVALALPWAAFSATTDPNRNYTASLWLRDPYNPELGRIAGPAEFADRFVGRASFYATAVLPPLLLPQPADRRTPSARWAAPAAAGRTGGLWLAPWRRVELPEVYMAGFLAILFSWPWTGDRFLLPVLPFILHYIAEALTALAGAVRAVLRRPRAAWAAAGAAGPAALAQPGPEQHRGQREPALPGRRLAAGGLTVEDRDFLAASDWLRDHTPPGGVVLARKSSIAEIYSGHPAELIPLIPPDQYLAWLRARHAPISSKTPGPGRGTPSSTCARRWPPTRPSSACCTPSPPPHRARTPTRIWQFLP